MSEGNVDNKSYDDAQTEKFLRTNGPPPGAFAPDPMVELFVKDLPDREKWLYRTQSTTVKQGDWIIPQISGIKAAHRTIHAKLYEGDARFKKIEATLDSWAAWKEKWLGRKMMFWKVALGGLTMLLLPVAGMLIVEYIKHIAGWK